MRQALSLDTLPNFDSGKAAVAFKQAIRRAVLDLLDRPGERSKRTVSLSVEMTPIAEQDGDVVDAEIVFTIQTKMPAMRTNPKPMACDRQGRLIFNDLADDNPHQTTIDETAE